MLIRKIKIILFKKLFFHCLLLISEKFCSSLKYCLEVIINNLSLQSHNTINCFVFKIYFNKIMGSFLIQHHYNIIPYNIIILADPARC